MERGEARSRRARLETAKVVHVRVEEPLSDIVVAPGYRDILLVVEARGAIVGQILMPAVDIVPAEIVASAITSRLGETLWLSRVEEIAAEICGSSSHGRVAQPTVSVVVCTRDRPEQLCHALDSLLALRSPPTEILVVDNCPSDERTRELCAGYPVRYLLEPTPGQSRARNRGVIEATGELVAFTDDDCRVDPRWLDGLGEPFRDPSLAAVLGYFGPRDLPTRSQFLFELDRDFERRLDARVVDDRVVSPVLGASGLGSGGNMIFRKAVLADIGMFAEDLGRGTPACTAEETYAFYRALAAGHRIAFDPTRIVWHDHRSTDAALRRVLWEDSIAVSAYAARCLVRHREPAALRVWAWCLLRRFPRDLRRALVRADPRMPLGIVLRQLAGTFLGPWRLLRSRRSRRGIPPLGPPLPAPAQRRLEVAGEYPRLSVVVPSHDREALLGNVLDALAGQTYPPERFEAVVVLDSASDGSAELLRTLRTPFPLRVVEHDRGSAAASRNRGAREATGPIVLFLDDDIVPEPGFLSAHADAHRHARDALIALGYCVPAVRGDTLWERDLRAWWEDHHRRKSEPGHVWTFTDLTVGNSSLPRDLFLEHLLDETLARREDWELGVRLLAAGAAFAYRPDARALHHVDVSPLTGLRLRRVEGAADVRLAKRHPGVVRQLALSAVADALARGAAIPHAAYRSRSLVAPAERLSLPVLSLLEHGRLRGRWRRLHGGLLVLEYVSGVADEVPTVDDLLELVVGSGSRGAASVPIDLVGGAPPAHWPSAPFELSVRWDGAPLSQLAPLAPNGQWEWSEVARRIVGESSDALRERLVRLSMLAEPVESAGADAERSLEVVLREALHAD